MPDSIIPPTHLSTSARRAPAASVIRTGTDLPAPPAQLIADQLDAVSAAVLRTAGLDDTAARAVLAGLWTE